MLIHAILVLWLVLTMPHYVWMIVRPELVEHSIDVLVKFGCIGFEALV